MELFLLRIPWGHCEVSLFVSWSLCVSQEVKSSVWRALSFVWRWPESAGLRERRSCRVGAYCLHGVGHVVPSPGVKQGVSCCPLSQHCGSGFAGVSEPQSSVPFLLLQGEFQLCPLNPLPGRAVWSSSGRHQCLTLPSTRCCFRLQLTGKLSPLTRPSPEQACFTGRSCLGGVWGGFYCWLGLSSSCSAGLSVPVEWGEPGRSLWGEISICALFSFSYLLLCILNPSVTPDSSWQPCVPFSSCSDSCEASEWLWP